MTGTKLFDLTDRIAVVTGASRGLGRAMAVGMAGAGATIVAVGRSEEALQETAAAVGQVAGRVEISRTDLCDDSAVQEMVDRTLSKFGRIDVLVNNAGITAMQRTINISKAEWNRVIDTNLNTVFVVSQSVGKSMIAKKNGSIINISSVLGKAASNQSLHYCASKAAVIQMTKALALEWAPHRIRVNCIAPGFFRNDMTRVQQENERHLSFLMNKIPLARFGEPEEIVGSAIYLASDASTYVTGSTLLVDGGYTTW